MARIVWFHGYTPAERAGMGGKNASLGELTLAGLPVPPGFALTAEVYQAIVGEAGLAAPLADLLQVDAADQAAVAEASRRARALVEEAPVPAAVEAALRAAYGELCDRCGSTDVAVAVRSSATCEDQPDASFAGEHDTFLWVRGADDVLAHVRRCWSSLFTARAICYRQAMGYRDEGTAMSVGVQKMVVPRASGVAFTLNPHDGDRSQVAIDASWGFGEAVVGGEVTPDNFLVDKVLGEVSRRTVSAKDVEYRLGGDDRVERVPVSDDRREAPCLTDDEIKAVAQLARRAETHYGCPQDVEWAVDEQLPAPDNVVLLQSRPETVWSRRERPPVSGADSSGDYLTSIVNTLVSPLHARQQASQPDS